MDSAMVPSTIADRLLATMTVHLEMGKGQLRFLL